MGGVQRAQMESIFEAFVLYGYTVVMAMAFQRKQGREPREVLQSIDSWALAQCQAYGSRLDVPFQNRLWREFDDDLDSWPLIMAGFHGDVFRRLFSTARSGAQLPSTLVMPAQIRQYTRRELHPHSPGECRWFLHCVDCPEVFVTDYAHDDLTALSLAKQLGWGKAKSNSWRNSTRCPQHHWQA